MQVTVTKADAPFQRLREIAKSMLNAGTVKTIEEGVSKAAKENPTIYAEYRRLFDEEARARIPQAPPRDPAPGSPSQPITKSSDAYRAIERLADGLIRSDPTLTKEQAIVKAAEQNPGLYREYRAAQMAEAEQGA